jgi:hypothetical protein
VVASCPQQVLSIHLNPGNALAHASRTPTSWSPPVPNKCSPSIWTPATRWPRTHGRAPTVSSNPKLGVVLSISLLSSNPVSSSSSRIASPQMASFVSLPPMLHLFIAACVGQKSTWAIMKVLLL